MRSHLNKFVRSYLATATWVEFDRPGDICLSVQAIRQAFEDCDKFMGLVDKHFMAKDAEYIISRPGSDLDLLAPHEFYLTRNRHGSGFWDGNWGELGDKLTEICHEMKECQLYVGDDGKAYFM